MCACVRACVYVCARVRACVCVCARARACVHACVCVCVIVKRPVLPPSVVDGRSRNPLYYVVIGTVTRSPFPDDQITPM